MLCGRNIKGGGGGRTRYVRLYYIREGGTRRGGHKIHVVWLSARAPGKLGNKEERWVGLVGKHVFIR